MKNISQNLSENDNGIKNTNEKLRDMDNRSRNANIFKIASQKEKIAIAGEKLLPYGEIFKTA